MSIEYRTDPIKEVYREDTVGRKYHRGIVTKFGSTNKGSSGEVAKVNLSKPLTREEFKKLPDSLQKIYIETLIERFDVKKSDVAAVLGYNKSHFAHKCCVKLGLSPEENHTRKTPPENIKRLEAFFKGEQTEVPAPVEEKVESVEPAPCETQEETPKTACAGVTRFEFEQVGEFNADELVARIHALIDEGTPCKISIQCERA